MEKRVFSEKEAAEILQAAAKLQAESESGGSYSPGVSFEELKKIAVEAGIDVSILEKAASTPRSIEQKTGLFPIVEEYERVVDGELDPNNFDVVFDVLKTASRQSTEQVGRTLQIKANSGGSLVYINISSKNERTKIHVRPTVFVPFMTTLYPAIIFSFISLMLLSVKGLWMFGLAGVFLFALISIPIFLLLSRRVDSNARKLADNLANAIQEENESMRSRLSATQPAPVEEINELHETSN